MKVNVRRFAYQAAVPALWAATFIWWAFLSVILIAGLIPAFLRWLFWFDTDPNPPGAEESDPSEGRFSRKRLQEGIAKAQLSLRL